MRLVAWLIPALLAAQAPVRPDARELIRGSAEAIKRYDSYQLESVVVLETRGGGLDNKIEMPTIVSVRRPDRMRIQSESQTAGLTIVGDGEHTWLYLTPQKRYIKRDATSTPEAALGEPGTLMQNFPDIAKSIKSIEVTREDAIQVGGERFDCWVVETSYNPITAPEQGTSILEAFETNWISKQNGLTLQSRFRARVILPPGPEPVEVEQSTRTTALRLNARLPETLFVFTPPAGAQETADWTLPGVSRPSVLTKPVADFKATAVDGSVIDLRALRGSVVLLHFCTASSAPCKREMPVVAKILREFVQHGLAVIEVHVGEELPDTIGPGQRVVVVNESSELVRKLAVNAFPTTVIVDREGNVASYEVGARGEEALRADLAQAGLK